MAHLNKLLFRKGKLTESSCQSDLSLCFNKKGWYNVKISVYVKF